jgi:hypothetical protein
MNPTRWSLWSRRALLKRGAAIAVSAAGIGSQAAGASQRTRRPRLSERTLNETIAADANRFGELAAEAKRDIRLFIQRRFELTAAQARQLSDLSQRELRAINEAIDLALETKRRIRVTFAVAGRADRASGQIALVQLPITPNIDVDGGLDPFFVMVTVKGDCG